MSAIPLQETTSENGLCGCSAVVETEIFFAMKGSHSTGSLLGSKVPAGAQCTCLQCAALPLLTLSKLINFNVLLLVLFGLLGSSLKHEEMFLYQHQMGSSDSDISLSTPNPCPAWGSLAWKGFGQGLFGCTSLLGLDHCRVLLTPGWEC